MVISGSNVWVSSWGGPPGGGGGSGRPPPTNSQPRPSEAPGIDLKAEPKDKDVRCSTTGENRNVTSESDKIERMLAANQLVANFNLKAGPYQVLARNIFAFATKGRLKFEVTYADGGTETWLLNPSIASSAKVTEPIDGTLKKPQVAGVKPSPNCPQ